MSLISEKKKVAETRQGKQNSILLNETNTSSNTDTKNAKSNYLSCIFEFLHINPPSNLIKNTTDIKKLYLTINQIKPKYECWGPNFDEWVCCRSFWAFLQFSSQLSTSKKVSYDIATRNDKLLSAQSGKKCRKKHLSKHSKFGTKGFTRSWNNLQAKIPIFRFNSVKVRLKWSELLTHIIEGCVTHPKSPENWKRLFAISKCVLRASNRGGKKHKQHLERLMLSRFERWMNGNCSGLCFEAASMKQAEKKKLWLNGNACNTCKISLYLPGRFEIQTCSKNYFFGWSGHW